MDYQSINKYSVMPQIVNMRNVDSWIETAKKQKCNFIVEAEDLFDNHTYPIYCKDEIDVDIQKSEFKHYKMQKIIKVIEI